MIIRLHDKMITFILGNDCMIEELIKLDVCLSNDNIFSCKLVQVPNDGYHSLSLEAFKGVYGRVHLGNFKILRNRKFRQNKLFNSWHFVCSCDLCKNNEVETDAFEALIKEAEG